ncbi:MAG: sensor histidine kinase, partial [Deinococcus sp.]
TSPALDALRRREELFFEGAGALSASYPELEAGKVGWSVASAVLPMVTLEVPRGVIALDFREPHTFPPQERRFLRVLAVQCGHALSRLGGVRRLEALVQERTRELNTLARLGDALQQAATPQQISQLALEQLGPALGALCMLVVRLDGGQIRLPTIWGHPPASILEYMTQPGLPLEALPLLNRVAGSGQGVYLDDYRQLEGGVSSFPSLAGAVEPIHTPDGRLEGFLVSWREKGGGWTPEHRLLLGRAAATLGLALERAHSLAQLAQRSLELEQRSRELERSNAELQQFAFVASHDLQEPLRSITSFSQLLVKRAAGSDDEKLQQYGRYISEGTSRMTQLLTDLLAFSRVASPGLTPKPVNTRLLLAQVQQDLGVRLPESGARLLFGELPQVYGDSTQLRQLFQNLVGNAVKFAHPGRPPEVRVSAEPGEQAAHFEVADNGIGIEEVHFERIFLIFQRLHGRQQYPGSGIGLAIARKVVERHGGQLSLRSTPGEGTTFTFTLPTHPGSFTSV